MNLRPNHNQEESVRIVFIHIPKAAGTSARVFFQEAYGMEKVGWLGVNFDGDQLKNTNISNLSSFKVIGGHFPYSPTEQFPWKCSYIAVLREPVSRAISLYRYIQRIQSHELHNIANSMSMFEMLESTPRFRAQVSNLQANWLSNSQSARGGKGTRDSALANIDNNKFIVSTMSSVESLFERIKEEFELPLKLSYGRQNISPERIEQDCLWEEGSLVDLLREINTEDTSLFEHVQNMPEQMIVTA